jgi:hypothetical protein
MASPADRKLGNVGVSGADIEKDDEISHIMEDTIWQAAEMFRCM